MRKLYYILSIGLCMAALQADAADMPAAGTAAPAFTLPGQYGLDVKLGDYHGKWVVLYFYPKDFTSGCSLEAHNFQADLAKYQARNAVIIGVSVDSVDSHKDFCVKQGLDFLLLADTKHKVSEEYGTTMQRKGAMLAARSTFLIDPSGVIRKAYADVKPAGHSAQVLADLDHLQSQEKR